MIKKFRVRKKEEFNKLFHSKCSRISNSSFKVICKKNYKNITRYGVCISSDVCENAVERNKVKRQVRSLIKIINIFKYSYDLIILVRPGVIDLTFKERYLSLKDCIDKAINREVKR